MSGPTAHWMPGRRALVVGSGPAADAVAEALVASGATIGRVAVGGTDAPEIAASFTAAEMTLGGKVDLLVHAGVPLAEASAETLGLDAWRSGFSADLDGRFLHVAEFARRAMAAGQGGNILFLMPSAKVTPGRSAAITDHGALDNLVKSLSVEWGRDGIRVNAIASKACEAGAGDVARASLGHLAAYLLSDYGAYITGTIVGIDEL